MKKKKRKKSKYNVKRIILAVLVLLALITGIVFLCVFLFSKGNNHDKNTGGTQGTVNEGELVSKGEYISISMDDCALYVGSELRLTCTSSPEDIHDKVVWSSSDEEIVSVTADGIIKVNSPGMAAITAKYGVLADSVAIEAILKDAQPDNEDVPVYTVENNETVIVSGGSSSSSQPQTETVTDSMGGVHSVVVDKTEPVTTNQPGQPEGGETTKPGSDDTGTGGVGGQSETKPVSPLKDQMGVHLTNLGFVPYIENSYVYYEDGNYLGEAIINDDYIHIYVMTRTSAFDNVMIQLIECVVPGKGNEIYAGFVSADKDATITSDGHRIRMIAPKKGDHSQLIIYF